MLAFQPAIKWSGSKRRQSKEIIGYFPEQIDIYYEPFLGGGSVLRRLIESGINVNEYVASDINQDLINFWIELKNNPEKLIKEYKAMWNELNSFDDTDDRKKYYYKVRDRYNKNKSVYDFQFLIRTCINGLIRYNSKGEFNSPFHFSRKGINPERYKKIILEWHSIINKKNVRFVCQDYRNVKTDKDDFLYLDPPYASTSSMYYGKLNYSEFWDWLRSQSCDYILSFNGISGDDDNTYEVPKDLYKNHIYLKAEISGFKKLHKKQEYVKESLYIK